ncbi:hypothetical protein BJV78DRAFT_1222250 [Lactifluus subvellereus]|nr:hypothetical protein BJV78DRAFT_1222250 [Lactifluus subvellereus]
MHYEIVKATRSLIENLSSQYHAIVTNIILVCIFNPSDHNILQRLFMGDTPLNDVPLATLRHTREHSTTHQNPID